MSDSQSQIAVFGGGCFWCTEAVFKMLKGVSSVTPGYAGGPSRSEGTGGPELVEGRGPSYEEVSSGKTGHAEVIRIAYDPTQIAFETLLTVFFATHDPTTPNRQGADYGTQYRSIVLYMTEEQKAKAEKFIADLNASARAGAKVVTEVKPLEKFFEAEDYHKDYFAKNPSQPYCQVVINPKLEKVQKEFAELLQKADKGS